MKYSSQETTTTGPIEPTEAAVNAVGLLKRFGSVTAVDQVSFSIQQGEFFSLLGPSGCGKTTLLRLIAGLDFADGGQLTILQRDSANWPAYQRPINTVFQSYALFPHMSVKENIAFGLRMKKLAKAEIDSRVEDVARMVQISDLATRFPNQLSGGQKQRVALARALVNQPEILLLDEPLGALDLKLRKQLQIELHRLQRRLGITFIYVTHDQDEALTMSDRVAVMNHGRIEQSGTPQDLYDSPRNRFVAQFLGSCNLLDAVCLSQGVFETGFGRLTYDRQNSKVRAGERCTLAIRPEKAALSRMPLLGDSNQFHATVHDVIFTGAETHYLLRTAEQELRCCAFNSVSHEPFKVGERIYIQLPPSALVVLDD